MYNDFISREKLMVQLSNPYLDLEAAIAQIPQKVWDSLFPDSTKEFDRFIRQVREKRARKMEITEQLQRVYEMRGHIAEVAYRPPHTTITWDDGTTTTVTCPQTQEYSKEQGLLHGMVKYLYNNTNTYKETIAYWVKNGNDSKDVSDAPSTQVN